MTRGTLIVFLKAPKAGRVKTRLARDVGVGRAAVIFRRLTEMTLRQAIGPWRIVLAISPTSDLHSWRHLWPRRFAKTAQSAGDLGARMRRAFDAAPPGPVVVIGADAPEIRRKHTAQAFRALKSADAVFGPAEDGGYWLIGLSRRKPAPRLFQDVRWSGEHALADTLSTLPTSFRVHLLERLRDIDDGEDLAALRPLLLSRR
jgi:rSAM/selenodomain-associated transferase 1